MGGESSLFIARIPATKENYDFLLAELQEAGTLGVAEIEEPGGALWLEAWFADEVAAREFGADVRPAPETDWVAVSRAPWIAREVGERFFLVPPWSGEPTPNGRLRLEYQPGMACGTGEHAGTRLALTGLERTVRSGHRVLDVGTGSGILSQAALLLGAAFVTACDIEEADILIAKQNTAAAFFVGSARALRSAGFDVVVANINAVALRLLLPDLRRMRAPGGVLVLAGFRPGEMAIQGAEALDLEGWQALIERTS